jgi:hypothetical protein
MKQQATTAEDIAAMQAAKHTATHSYASGGTYTDTETTIRCSGNAAWVDIRCIGNLQWWEQPPAEQLRSWVDQLIKPLGMMRDSARVSMSAPGHAWRFLYSLTPVTSKEETAEQLTPVRIVFRYETSFTSDNPVTAVFADGEPREREFRTIYNHVGQHSSANRGWYENNTRPATKEEYAGLLAELQAIGYAVTPVSRVKWSK